MNSEAANSKAEYAGDNHANEKSNRLSSPLPMPRKARCQLRWNNRQKIKLIELAGLILFVSIAH